MNSKIKYALPALAAVFALMFVVATPYVMAEPGSEKTWNGGKKAHKFFAVQADGFVGSIPITNETDKATLKEQITVSLSEAANGLDIQRGHIGIVTNENGEKFLAWNLISMDKDAESEIRTITIHIVDAGNAQNTAQVTKEFNPAEMTNKFKREGKDLPKPQGMTNDKKTGFNTKFVEPTGNEVLDALNAEFAQKMLELRDAMQNGDSKLVQQIRGELEQTRNQITDVRRA